jgi:hypothetical protein
LPGEFLECPNSGERRKEKAMAVTVTYSISPNIVGTTPPTARQASGLYRFGAQVAFSADTDTTALVTHNWGFTTTQLANLQPVCHLYAQTAGTAAGLFSIQLTNSNAITISKGSTVAGSGSTTLVVQMFYPQSSTE